ncbi:hypothetical protein BC941DRAFT_473280 [Chlamydoabsidia padenii]|nr:hypothetical protein BC941DRAFT_473280 [Chlamydoabsidia padenii]
MAFNNNNNNNNNKVNNNTIAGPSTDNKNAITDDGRWPATKTKVIAPFDTPPPTPQQGLQTYYDNNTILDNSLIPYLKTYSNVDDDHDSHTLFGPSPLPINDNASYFTGGTPSHDTNVLDDEDIFMEIDNTFNSFDSIIPFTSPPPSPLLTPCHHTPSYPSTDFVLFP